jgi:hypothetical protein
MVHLALPRDAEARAGFMAGWRSLIARGGRDRRSAICILPDSAGGVEELYTLAQESFGDRCVVGPSDDGEATRALIADDLARTFRERGRFDEWAPYEFWTATMARRWAEGLRRSLAERGYTWGPALNVVSFGQQWAGCLTKYSMLMPRLLGVTRTPRVRVNLCPDAGWPMRGRFVERVGMGRRVSLYLFETPDGRPMGQYLDGLRAIWEAPHAALVPTGRQRIETRQASPNEHLPVGGPVETWQGGVVADVGDGCHARFTTLLGRKGRYDAFKQALAAARIIPRRSP